MDGSNDCRTGATGGDIMELCKAYANTIVRYMHIGMISSYMLVPKLRRERKKKLWVFPVEVETPYDQMTMFFRCDALADTRKAIDIMNTMRDEAVPISFSVTDRGVTSIVKVRRYSNLDKGLLSRNTRTLDIDIEEGDIIVEQEARNDGDV